MRVDFSYRPLPKNAAFHRCEAYEATLYGGYGSGKSYALCADAIARGLEQPGSRILVTRKTIPSLRDTTEQIFVDMLPPNFFGACETKRSGGHYQEIVFPNGSTYLFRGMDEWTKHKSLNLSWLYYDEADEIDEESYIGMLSRVRQRDPTSKAAVLGAPKITRRGVRCVANPSGHDWLWKRFVSDKDRAPNTTFFTSTSLDNPYLPIEYINSLLDMPKPWVRRYVLCSFDEFSGQIYESWDDSKNIVVPYKEFPPASLFWFGMDPGTRLPTAGVWCYLDKGERPGLVAVAEYCESSLAAREHANAWRRIESRMGLRVSMRIADPSIATRDRGTNMALEDIYRRLGFSFIHGPRKIDDRLPALGGLIHSGFFRVTQDCPQLIEQIKNYRWADLTPAQRAKGLDAPEKPLKRNVDLVDAAQYVSSRYISPPPIVANPARTDKEQFDAEVRAEIRRRLSQRRTATPSHDLGTIRV